MQALAERLEAAVGGAAFEKAVPISFSGLKTYTPAPESLAGRTLASLGRRGKFLILDFGGPRVLVHLSQGGRVDVESPPKSTRPKFGVVRFLFDGRPSVLVKEFGTEKKAGWWVLAEGDEGPLAGLGPEPFSDEFAELILRATTAGGSTPCCASSRPWPASAAATPTTACTGLASPRTRP